MKARASLSSSSMAVLSAAPEHLSVKNEAAVREAHLSSAEQECRERSRVRMERVADTLLGNVREADAFLSK